MVPSLLQMFTNQPVMNQGLSLYLLQSICCKGNQMILLAILSFLLHLYIFSFFPFFLYSVLACVCFYVIFKHIIILQCSPLLFNVLLIVIFWTLTFSNAREAFGSSYIILWFFETSQSINICYSCCQFG